MRRCIFAVVKPGGLEDAGAAPFFTAVPCTLGNRNLTPPKLPRLPLTRLFGGTIAGCSRLRRFRFSVHDCVLMFGKLICFESFFVIQKLL